jgi:hypothetical protein
LSARIRETHLENNLSKLKGSKYALNGALGAERNALERNEESGDVKTH